MIEIRELLRRWQRGDSYRKVADAVGIDRKTVRRYVEAARRHGFARNDDAVVSDELVGTVIAEVSPGAPPKIGVMRQLCRDHRDLLVKWRGGVRVDGACQQALELDVVDVPRVARMLERELDMRPVEGPPPTPDNVIRPRFGRDPKDFTSGASHDA